MKYTSPYYNKPIESWANITNKLIEKHPLSEDDIVDSVFKAWEGILNTKIGGYLKIGVDVFPSPQITGNYLHELVPAILANKYPDSWRKEITKKDKDLVYIPNNDLSIEIKTSSQNRIYGNRSYGQPNSDDNSGKKKYGFYLGINFEKITKNNPNAEIKTIKFGWIDHLDWVAQASQTGQSAPLSINAWNFKMKTLYKL